MAAILSRLQCVEWQTAAYKSHDICELLDIQYIYKGSIFFILWGHTYKESYVLAVML